MNHDSSTPLHKLNQLSRPDAEQWFSQCCAAPKWYQGMTLARPFGSVQSMLDSAHEIWQSCSQADFMSAFEAHPMIGDVNSLRKKYAATKAMAGNEQQGADQADEQTLQALAKANHEYLNRHGFIFIICATDLSANTMLQALLSRLNNDTASEITMAAAEQMKITLLRLNKGIQTL